ncbi:hypothetical protein COU76_01160 [Candidatus Peregrinibacteria bacterium CG10_big_fil_rev_8_21_14_0_10_49_10]|nr:MAG: hypothetical protein COU76_01160 [Candidatus Peregrinibacteria bacterium CG10_big_fil_rev_8_21_14_0_10_49_10]
MIPSTAQLRWLRTWTFRLLLAISFIFAVLMLYIVSQFSGTAGGGEWQAGTKNCAIVFGAAVWRGSQPGPAITRRVQTAAALYQQGDVQTIILTGGKGTAKLDSEAEVMRKVALLDGVDPDDVVLEEQARSTWENLLFTKDLVGDCSSIVGISDRYHLARIAYLAKLQGWEDLRTLPAGEVPTLLFELKAVAREAVGLVYYFMYEQLK